MKKRISITIAAATICLAWSLMADEVPPGGTQSARSKAQETDNLDDNGKSVPREEVPPAGVPGLTPGGGPKTREPQPVNVIIVEGSRRYRSSIPVSVGVGLGYNHWHGDHWYSSTSVGFGGWPYYGYCNDWYPGYSYRPRSNYWLGFSSWFPIHEDDNSRWSVGLGVGTGGSW
ncbi:MAG TPA: hypothetical protein PL033_00110 [Candidatus Brocadiia bacterium]|nr:hypothetical protein [Candidatus Brocadiia bacterium]